MRYRLLCCILALFLLLLGCSAPSAPTAPEEMPYVNTLTYSLSKSRDCMDCVMLRVGKSDAMLLSTEHHTLLLDAGERNDADADKIIEYLKYCEITHLDAVVVSNVLTDNIGGLDRILKAVSVGEILHPAYNATGHRQTKFLRMAAAANVPTVALDTPTTRVYDGLTLTMYPAENPVRYTREGDMSLVTTLAHGENTLLFTSNVGPERIDEVMETLTEPFDAVKLPDHGVWFEALPAFLDLYAPEHVLISDSSLHEAAYDTLSLLAERDMKLHRTAEANICIFSNGKRLYFEHH